MRSAVANMSCIMIATYIMSQIISGKIDQRTEEKTKLSLGRPMGPMLVAQTREQTIEWAVSNVLCDSIVLYCVMLCLSSLSSFIYLSLPQLKVAKQPDSTVKKELYAVLDQVRKYMVLYGGGAAARATTTARGRSSLESSRGASKFLVLPVYSTVLSHNKLSPRYINDKL